MVKMPVRAIVAAIAAAAERWANRAFEPRARARDAVVARTGYAPSAVDYAFDALFGSIRGNQIEAVIVDELGCLDVLDHFVSRAGRPAARALPIGRVCILSSRTTIGVAIVPAIFALCAKCDVLVKDRDDHLTGAFFQTLARELPSFRDAAVAQSWESAAAAVDLNGFAAVVAFGDDATLAQLGAELRFPTSLLAFGSKASAGYVTRESLDTERSAAQIAASAARDLVLYESEGCLSLHTIFIENGGAISPERFAEMLSLAVRAAAVEFPPRADAATALRLAAARELALLRTGAAHSDPGAGYLVALEPGLHKPPLFLPRAIALHCVESPAQTAAYLERHGISLEALAVSSTRPDLLELAVRIKAARVTTFGSLQAPPLGAFHGGRPRVAEFVRWIVDEA